MSDDSLKTIHKFARWLEQYMPEPDTMVVVHLALTIGWAIALPVAIFTGWLWSIAFVSACSIYANFVGHFAALEAALGTLLTKRLDENNPNT